MQKVVSYELLNRAWQWLRRRADAVPIFEPASATIGPFVRSGHRLFAVLHPGSESPTQRLRNRSLPGCGTNSIHTCTP